jgi:hypothetical protein
MGLNWDSEMARVEKSLSEEQGEQGISTLAQTDWWYVRAVSLSRSSFPSFSGPTTFSHLKFGFPIESLRTAPTECLSLLSKFGQISMKSSDERGSTQGLRTNLEFEFEFTELARDLFGMLSSSKLHRESTILKENEVSLARESSIVLLPPLEPISFVLLTSLEL